MVSTGTSCLICRIRFWQSRWNAMKLPWRMARNLNRIGDSMKRAQEICRGRERVNIIFSFSFNTPSSNHNIAFFILFVTYEDIHLRKLVANISVSIPPVLSQYSIFILFIIYTDTHLRKLVGNTCFLYKKQFYYHGTNFKRCF